MTLTAARPGQRPKPTEALFVTRYGAVGHRASIIGPAVAACGVKLDGAQLAFAPGLRLCGWCARSAHASLTHAA